MGLDAVTLNAAEAQALEPDVALDVLGAVHYRCDGHLYPPALMAALIQRLKNNDVTLVENAEVTGFNTDRNRIKEVVSGSESFSADKIIIAGGAWLGDIARFAGLNIPIMPGKGYSFMTEAFSGKVRHPALLLEARVALTPMGGHVRIGGTMELAAVNTKTNMSRVQGIVESIPAYYPEYKLPVPPKNKIWYGFRPCSPDGLPYLGRSHKYNNLIVAGGLGMMGLSLGQASGKVVADLAGGNDPGVSIDVFNPERFN